MVSFTEKGQAYGKIFACIGGFDAVQVRGCQLVGGWGGVFDGGGGFGGR